MIASLSPLPLPKAALTSRVTLGYVAKSLHKLVCEVTSPPTVRGISQRRGIEGILVAFTHSPPF